jgi:hypothetical protein
MSANWILLTAGFGSEDMQAAARRVQAQAASMNVFSQVIAVTNSNLDKNCPVMVSRYGQYLTPEHKGFGYFCWKIELVHSALDGAFGLCDGVVWVDAGCEVYNSFWTKLRLKSWMRRAEKKGTFVYTLDTPEQDYTKLSLFSHFPRVKPSDRSPQFQATWFMLYGEVGREIANEWMRISLLDIATLDLSTSPGGEVSTFVEHRFDQSILSLTLKTMDVKKENYHQAGGNTGVKSQVRAILHPIWTSRNRTQKSLQIKFLVRLGKPFCRNR